MAIRCSELSIPAVIGCGEQIYSELTVKKKNNIFIDCSASLIYSNQSTMLKIAISQRLGFSKHGELRSQIDTRLVDFIFKCGFQPIIIPYFNIKNKTI